MSIFEYIAIALAFSIESMTVMRTQAEKTRIPLTQGVGIAVLFAIAYALMMLAGLRIGNILRFEDTITPNAYATANTLVYVGLSVLLAIKIIAQTLKKKGSSATYDISRWPTVIALALASSIDALILGLGIGFLPQTDSDILKATIPLLIGIFLLSYLGIMFGRQATPLRQRRWHILSVLLLLSIAIYRIIAL